MVLRNPILAESVRRGTMLTLLGDKSFADGGTGSHQGSIVRRSNGESGRGKEKEILKKEGDEDPNA